MLIAADSCLRLDNHWTLGRATAGIQDWRIVYRNLPGQILRSF